MELRELGDRLLRLHAKMIIGMILAGVLAALAIHVRDRPQYMAEARLVFGAQDPQNVSAAAALADTARGIATGPHVVATAISGAGARRSEAKVAAAINVVPIGSSGVLLLSVSDADPRVAVKLANSVAASVVNTRVAMIENGMASSLRRLDHQEAATDRQLQRLDTQIETLAAQIVAAGTQPTGQNPAAVQLDQMQAQRTSLADQATQLAVQRNDLAAQQAQRPETAVIDKAVAALPVHGRRLLDVMLGGLLGLVAGIALAALREAVRPSLVGTAAISRAVGAPQLGEMSTPPDIWTVAALPDAGTYVELAADASQVQEVRFAALDPHGRRGARVRPLEGPLHRLAFGPQARPGRTAPGKGAPDGPPGLRRQLEPASTATATASSTASPDDMSTPRTGLVVAVPRVLKLADVDALTNFVWISGWTLLGVIVYRPSRNTATTSRRRPGSRRDSSPARQVEVDR